ncbi:MAG: hypothetical protein JNK82_07410 [Myxococcaceae bacterium]|nr:hypothetical protein [Myxococcaceae bacterium]
MPVIELTLAATPKVCFDTFLDLASARHWVPGLKKLRIVRSDEKGRPLEVLYEFGDDLTYALVYAYDDKRSLVRWVPSAGVLDGVSGWATFEAHEGGCRFRYALESMKGRAKEHPQAVADAFKAWVLKRVTAS